MLRTDPSKSALTVTLMAVIPDDDIASRCCCESGPRGGHETFIDPGLANASITIARWYKLASSCDEAALSRVRASSGATPSAAPNWRLLMVDRRSRIVAGF